MAIWGLGCRDIELSCYQLLQRRTVTHKYIKIKSFIGKLAFFRCSYQAILLSCYQTMKHLQKRKPPAIRRLTTQVNISPQGFVLTSTQKPNRTKKGSSSRHPRPFERSSSSFLAFLILSYFDSIVFCFSAINHFSWGTFFGEKIDERWED